MNVPDGLGTNQQERMWSKWGQIYTEIQKRYSAFLSRIFLVRAKIQTPKPKTKMLFIREFCGFNSCQGLFGVKHFPTEKLKKKKKNTGACNTPFFKKCLICKMWRIFPPKDLEKYGAQNTHASIFFQNSDISVYVANKMNFFNCCLVLSPTFSQKYSFSHLSIYIYSVNHKSFKFNKVFILLNY